MQPDGEVLSFAVDDEAASWIVGRNRHGHAVTQDDADSVAARTTGEFCETLMAIFALHAEISAFANVNHFTLELN
jgi:hypothetical protein